VIAPDRVNLGSLHEMQASSVSNQPNDGEALSSRAVPTPGLIGEARLAWDTVSYAWDSQVLSFDVEGQRDFLTWLGIESVAPGSTLLWLAAAAVILLGAYAAFILRRAHVPSDLVKMLYERFCRSLARRGVARSAVEGPVDFARRAADAFPQHAAAIRAIASDYIALRYSPRPDASAMQSFATDVRAFVRRARAR
jgi:hypothetical protein